ncbi:MAG: hypothetical protein MI924_16250 [Chloroflexales bacterium]|nr:hypothetical protein [Chloroflexales bacterium]
MLQQDHEPERLANSTEEALSDSAIHDVETTVENACTIARRVVAEQWPQLACVEPTVTFRHGVRPSRAALRQLGLEESEEVLKRVDDASYTFTFAAQERTPEGYIMPRIARVTVDAHQRVIKATLSK